MINKFLENWLMGIGDWGLGIGDWGLGPIPQSPIPIPNRNKYNINILYYLYINEIKLIA